MYKTAHQSNRPTNFPDVLSSRDAPDKKVMLLPCLLTNGHFQFSRHIKGGTNKEVSVRLCVFSNPCAFGSTRSLTAACPVQIHNFSPHARVFNPPPRPTNFGVEVVLHLPLHIHTHSLSLLVQMNGFGNFSSRLSTHAHAGSAAASQLGCQLGILLGNLHLGPGSLCV